MLFVKIHITPLTWWSYGSKDVTLHFVLWASPDTDQKTECYQKLMLPQQGNLSLQQMKTFTENYRQSKFRVVKSTGNAYTYKTFPTPKTQGTMQKRQSKEWKRQRNMDFIVNFGFLVISQIHKILPTWLPKYDLHKDNTNELTKMDGEKSLNLNPKQRTRGNWSENWRRGLSYTRMQYLFVQC